jgi:hypothetical protein
LRSMGRPRRCRSRPERARGGPGSPMQPIQCQGGMPRPSGLQSRAGAGFGAARRHAAGARTASARSRQASPLATRPGGASPVPVPRASGRKVACGRGRPGRRPQADLRPSRQRAWLRAMMAFL